MVRIKRLRVFDSESLFLMYYMGKVKNFYNEQFIDYILSTF
jgi:hypothetical protein